jgi:hypothetical protein
MFVLSYFRQDMDFSDFKILAVSKSEEVLLKRKMELQAPAIAYAIAYKEYVERAKKGVREYALSQKQAVKINKHAHVNYIAHEIEKAINHWVTNYYYFVGNDIHRQYLSLLWDLSLLTEPLPVFLPPEKPTVECYAEDSWGGQGLSITEVEEI